MQHYHQGLSTQTNAPGADDLLSDGVFLRHYLLFVYDICIEAPDDQQDSELWPIHLQHLQRIATLRRERLGRDPHGYLIWSICELDMYACLLGSGNCDFFRSIMKHNMLPPLDQHIPSVSLPPTGPYLACEATIFPSVLSLNQGIVLRTAKMAQIAQSFRNEASHGGPIPADIHARWQATVSQLQSDLSTFWLQSCPPFLEAENPRSAARLPERVRYIFERVCLL